MKKTHIALTGLLAGILLTIAGAYLAMPAMMIRVQESPMGLEETVATLKLRAEQQGWVISGITAIDESIAKHGGGTVPRVRLINFCQADYAAEILRDPKARHVSVFMPCTISVYESDDGKVHISSMNAGLMGRMMGGTIARVMGGSVAADQREVLAISDQ